jgi:lipid-binding SYLF domain-containing protein
MSKYSRRIILSGMLASTIGLAACSNGVGTSAPDNIDARVTAALDFLYSNYPGTQDLRDKSAGMLVMPVVTEAGFGLGGSYGRGALRVADATVDYYSATQASFGLQIGAQQYSHVLFFMTQEALQDFRTSPGWTAGAELEYAFRDQAENISAKTLTATSPVIAVVFAQTGAIAGATVEGTKYTRIIPGQGLIPGL